MARWNSQKGSIFVDGSHMEVMCVLKERAHHSS